MFALAAAGCATVPASGVVQFQQNLAKAREHTDQTFDLINQQFQADALDRAVKLNRLREDDIRQVITPVVRQRYSTAFNQMDQYASKLAELLSPNRAQECSDSVAKLGEGLKATDPQLLPSAGVATGIAALGQLLVEAKAQSDAMAVARQTDPAVQKICEKMFDAIGNGDENDPGLRRLLQIHYNNKIKSIELEFSPAGGNPPNEQQKREIVQRYLATLADRDTQDAAMQSVAQTYLNLARAHSALARGSAVDMASALDSIKAEIQATQELFKKYSELKKKGPANG
jgi:hypothetical protein